MPSLPYYLERYTSGELTEAEWNELKDLLNDPATGPLLDQHLDAEMVALAGKIREDLTLTSRLQTRIAERIDFEQTKPRVYWWRYAAAAVVVLSIGTVAYLWNTTPTPLPQVVHTDSVPVKNDVAPGGNRAVLTLGDKRRIVLDSAANGLLANEAGSRIEKTKEGALRYSNEAQIENESVALNTLSTPRGGQYQLTLPDGSKVWLNAASSITFPNMFNGEERNVSITGEVYFEVQKDSRPFTVAVGDQTNVQVLGTHFNVNAYPEEQSIRTTLLEGKVRVKHFDQELVMKPGQQARFEENRLLRAPDPDVDQVIAWKNGTFVLHNTDLPSIMRQLTRWYDIEVRFDGPPAGKTLSGVISRTLPLSDVLDLLKNSGVQFRLEGRTLHVQP